MPRALPALLTLCLALVLLAGCGAPEDAGGSPDPQGQQPLHPVALPDLLRMPESVHEQFRQAYAAVTTSAAAPAAPAADLAAAYGELGSLFFAALLYDEAQACFFNAHSLAPDDARWAYFLAHAYGATSDSVRAITFYERTLALEPNHVAALVYLGDKYLAQGKPEAAVPPLTKALTLESRLAVALFGLGRAALAMRDYSTAVQQLERALALDPKASMARYSLAMAYRGLGDLEQAEAHLRERGEVRFAFLPDPLMARVGQLLPSAESYEFQGGAALTRGEWDLAALLFGKGVELAPDNPVVRMKLAEALRYAGRARESLPHYTRALEDTPEANAAPGRFGQAMALVRLERYEEARDRLLQGMEAHPDQLPFRQALVRLLAAAPDDEVRDGWQALAMTRDMLTRDQTPDLYETMAMALAEVGQFDEAVDLQRRLIDAARRAERDEIADGLTVNLRRYEARQPCRTPWTDADMP